MMPEAIHQYFFFGGVLLLLTIISLAMKIWMSLKPKSPCQIGEQRYLEMCSKLKNHEERLGALARRSHDLRKEIKDDLGEMAKTSQESDRRINQRLNGISEMLSELKGSLKLLLEDRKS